MKLTMRVLKWSFLSFAAVVPLTGQIIVNAASQLMTSSVSPGELITIYRYDYQGNPYFGPSTPVIATSPAEILGGTRVAFTRSGFVTVYASLLYVSRNQINAIVPYGLSEDGDYNVYIYPAGASSTGGFILFHNFRIASVLVALFTVNGSGTGPAAALNQDNSYNGPNNPAAKGSYVSLYLTGEGETYPKGVTGGVTVINPKGQAGCPSDDITSPPLIPPLTPEPLQAVTVVIDGQPARIAFCGEAPGLVSGVMQINVQVPPNARSGNLPVQVLIGNSSTLSGVTVSVG